MIIKSVHFGARVKEVRIELFDTQKKMAEWLHVRGVLRRPNQTTVQNWEQQANLSKKVITALAVLAEKGVNPQYFYLAHVTTWRGPAVKDMDEGQILDMRMEIARLRGEVLKLRKDNQELLEEVEKLRKEK